jgi:hypothetical protein
MKKIKVKITATVETVIEVEVNDEGLSTEELHDAAIEQANEQFDITQANDEEKYTQNAEVIEE